MPSPKGPISIVAIDPHSKTATELVSKLIDELSWRYANCDGHEATSFEPADAAVARSAFVLASLNGEPIGCGAIRPFHRDVAEIKRMFVREKARGHGIGRAILAELEQLALDFRYSRIVLETGVRQPEAIALYRAQGFSQIPHFVTGADNPLSICFEKIIR